MMAVWQLTYYLGIGILFNTHFQLESQAGESRGSGSNGQR
jgi:hypothetical protein